MELQWNNGSYTGECEGGVPHGKGTLCLPEGAMRGIWEGGHMIHGCAYIGGELYVGEYDREGWPHGSGFFAKDNGRQWRGIWEHGRKVADERSDPIPNCVIIHRYYHGIELVQRDAEMFPAHGKMGEWGYHRLTKAERYEMPRLTEAFGRHIVAAVERCNNTFDFSRGSNIRALYFTDGEKPMYTDALVCGWQLIDYAPFDPVTAEAVYDYVCDFLKKNPRDRDLGGLDETLRRPDGWTYLLLDEGIYHGEVKDGLPEGEGCLVYNHDDPAGRACYIGPFEGGKPHGYRAALHYRLGAPDQNLVYEGPFADGLFAGGIGTLRRLNGSVNGTWAEGRLEGDRCTVRRGTEEWYGCFKAGEMISGTYTDSERGYRYEGQFAGMKADGEGSEILGNVAWTGLFRGGKRLIGEGPEREANALELVDPQLIIPIDCRDWQDATLALRMATTEIRRVSGGRVQAMADRLGAPLMLIVAAGTSGGGLTKKLFSEDAVGSCILCGSLDGEPAPLTAAQLKKLRGLIEWELDCIKQQCIGTYTLQKLGESQESHWVVTRETHDDYPLEGYERYNYHVDYRLTVGEDAYYFDYTRRADYPYDANDSSVEEDVETRGRGRVHRIPAELTELEAIKAYAAAQNKWSQEGESRRFSGKQAEFAEQNLSTSFVSEVLGDIFGIPMTPCEA